MELRSDGLRRMTQQMRAIKADGRYFPPNEVISERFKVGELIGKGPFGEVYRAEDTLIDAEVAVKIFDPKLIENPVHQEQFLRTARTARTMTQTNVVRVHGSGVHKDHAWVSMQALEGLSLRKVLKMRRNKGEKFTLEELEPIVSQITLAVQHINREFPHGNLKPENIIFLPELIKLTDHYLYAAIDHEMFADRASDSPYVAPELHTPSEEADPRCDVYSLGMLIGEMLFGPDYTPGSPPSDRPEVAGVDALVRRATAFDPSERYPSVEALSEDFVTLVDTGSLLHSSGDEISVPEPAGLAEVSTPPPPPQSAPADDLLLEETPSDIAEPIEDDIATREYDRDEPEDPELGDLLETNEVRREELPPPPKGAAAKLEPKEETKTAIKPPPGTKKNDDDSDTSPALIFAGLIALVGLIGAIMWMSSGKDEGQHVEIGDGDEASVEASETPEGEEKGDETETADKGDSAKEASGKEVAAAAEKAGKTMLAARGKAVVAAKKAEETSAKDDAEGLKDMAEAAAMLKGEKADDGARASTSSESKTAKDDKGQGAAKKASGGAAKKDTKEEKKAAATGTKCKPGMLLVKSKKGNYCIDAYEYPARGVKPKTNVSWFKAKQLCNAKGKRLCKLSEWRRACGSKYPYGRKWDANKCNTVDEDEFERSLAAAGSFSSCRSWTGARDMTGNAHEWVAEQRIAGGGFDSGPEVASCRYSSPKAPGSGSSNIGFRCCANPE
jgi:serine/threonine protein kinase